MYRGTEKVGTVVIKRVGYGPTQGDYWICPLEAGKRFPAAIVEHPIIWERWEYSSAAHDKARELFPDAMITVE